MNERVIELSLDLNCKTSGPVVHLTQFDKGVSIRLSASLDGAFFSLSGTTVILKGIDARKGQVLLECQVNGDGTATATTLDSTFSEDGVAVCKFVISDTTKTYATQTFLVDVDDSLDAEIHDDRYSLLGKLIREILLMDEHGGILVDEELDPTSNHPVQNKVICEVLSHLVEYVTNASVDNATETGKVYYTTVGSSKALIVPVSGDSSQVQFRLDRDGKIYARRRSRSSTSVDFPPWGSFADIAAGVDPEIIRQIVEAYIAEHGIDLTGVERTENRVNAINAQSDDEHYPTAGAVLRVYQSLDEADANIRSSIGSLESGKANKSETYTKTQVDTALSGKANTSDIPDISGKADKATTLAGYGITDAYKKIEINQMFNQVDADLQAKADQSNTYSKTEVDTKLSGKANTSDIPDVSGKADKATTLSGYGISNAYTKTQTDTLLNAKESTANKVTAVNSSASDTQYPSAKAVYQAISILANNGEVKANKVTAIGSGSTDTQYPSAKAVYTELSGKADKTDTYTKSEVDSLVNGGVVPQYVIDEAESVLAKAFAHKGLGRTIRFIAVSDSHNDATEASHDYTRVSNQHCGQAVKYIADRIPLDFVASLGDMTWAGVAHTTAQYQTDWLKEDIQEMNLFLKDGFSGVPNIRVVGNHDQCATTDSGGTVSRLQNNGAYQYFGRYNAGVSDGLSNYGYYDLNNVKVRIIYLNTSDAVNVSNQGTYLGITAAQKNWLCETLIDLNTKTDAASWKILLMSHVPLDMISGLAADILIPYTNGGTYGSYTFTNHSAKIIGNCHGHTHCYNVGYISDKIRRFTIPNSNFYDNNHYKNNASYAAWAEETTYPKTQNSRTDTSFSLVTIDLDSLTCYVDNYGAGYDREFNLDYKPAPGPANLFDKDDPDVILRARFNSSMQPVDFADEQLVTGFVPASVGTSFTVETDKANNTNGYTGFIMLYNSSKQPIGGLSNATAPFVWSSDYKSGTVTIPQSYINTNFEGTEYARFCLAYVDIDNIEIYKE